MRTTLDIDDDVRFMAKDFARRDKKTLGATVSSLIRRGLASPAASSNKSMHKDTAAADDALAKLGIYPLPSRGGIVTNELINAIREQEGI